MGSARRQSHAFFTLWSKYGKWDSEASLMFEQRPVQRQAGNLRASDNVVVPTTCTVLRLSNEDREEHRLDLSGIFIRDDYLKSLYDICQFATDGSLPLQAVAGTQTLRNPFVNGGVPSKMSAITMLGHPGIGKSLWLIVVLVLRILAGCPTIYHAQSDISYIFNAAGLYTMDITNRELRAESHFYKAISPPYWCLVDCNPAVPVVPYFLSTLRAFIVQAASPRSDRIDWVKKYNWMSGSYFMTNWSLAELIMCRTLQSGGDPCSERALEFFYSRYAPSARMAYAYAKDPAPYDDIVTRDMGGLTLEAFSVEGVSHQILLISPDTNRSGQLITIPSRYMYIKLRDQLHAHTLEEVARLYQVFVRNQFTKESAGYILDDVHDLFRMGGQWEIASVTGNKPGPLDTHFKTPSKPKKSSYMCIGYGGERLTIASEILPEDAEFSQLAHYRFLLGENITLQDGYYQPAPGQPTFDGFIYDGGTQTATMLQMTVATHHDVKIKCVEWLIQQGAREIRLVAVKPPSASLDLSIPNNLTSIVNVFELALESVNRLRDA